MSKIVNNWNLDEFDDYQIMKEKLMIQLIPLSGNEERRKLIPHKLIHDMLLVYRFVIDKDEKHFSSILVTNQHLEEYGISHEELHVDACISSAREFPFKIQRFVDVIASMIDMPSDMIMNTPGNTVYVVSSGFKGAGCIFYPGVLDYIARVIGGDFWVLPSSIHEMMIVPYECGITGDEYREVVRDINATCVSSEEKLTNSVYYYDSLRGTFDIVEE